MPRVFDRLLIGLVLALTISTVAQAEPPAGKALGLGAPVTSQELSKFFAIPPDGAGLPEGQGSVTQGKEVYTTYCSACHGDKLQGVKMTGAPALIGGRGSLTRVPPLKTTESYWPYATTMFDYIKRAMPFNAPGSLSDDQVYALVAYILAEGHVVPDATVLNKDSLPKVAMPNRSGFRPYSGPDKQFFHKVSEGASP